MGVGHLKNLLKEGVGDFCKERGMSEKGVTSRYEW